MKPARLTLRTLPAASALLLLTALAAQAQVNVGSNYTVSGSAQAGGFVNPVPSTNNAKFRQYQDLAQQIIAPELQVLLHDSQDQNFAEFNALNLGQTNELYDLHLGEYGVLDIDAQWQEIPHFLSDNAASSPYQLNGGNFTLNSRPAAPTAGQPSGANIDQWLSTSSVPISLSLLEGIANLNIRYTPSPEWTYSVYYNYINQTGNLPYGELFGASPGTYNVTQLFAPVQYRTYNYGAGVQWANGVWLLGLQYEGSFFNNANSTLTWQNPDTWNNMSGPGGACVSSASYNPSGGTGPCVGRDQLYPDNQAHTFTVTGGLALPLDTHLMGSFSYGWWLQNQNFIPFTANNALPAQGLPQQSLGGDVSPMFANFTAVSRPLTRLRLKATYSYFDYDNHDPAITFANISSLNDVSSTWSATAYPFSFSTQTIKGEASYNLTETLVASLVGNIQTYHNGGMMVLQQDMFSGGPVLDWMPKAWLEMRGSYQYAHRDSPGYNNDRTSLVNQNGGTAEFAGLMRYDEATVDVNQFSLYADAQPFQANQESAFNKSYPWLQSFTLYAQMDYDNYSYPQSQFGLGNWSDYTPSAGVNWSPLSKLNLYADWSWTATDWKLSSFQRQSGGTGQPMCPSSPTAQTPALCPGQTWTSYGRQQGNAIDVGFDVSVPGTRLLPHPSHLRLSYSYTVTTALTHANGDAALGGATDFPNVGTRFNQLIVNYSYPIRQRMALDVGYLFSNFGENDFGFDRLMPWMSAAPQSMLLGNTNWTPYTGNTAYVAFKYRF